MVKKKESKILLKLLVDKKKDQVVAAESGVDFMDILAGTVGCMNNLYQSVENLDEEDMYIEHCKTLLLNPINPYPKYCMKLKVNLDDSGSYYYMNVECKCNGKYNKETFLKDSVENACSDEYVFRKGGISFLISDGLQVRVASPSSLVQMLSNVGLSDMNQIEEMHVEIGKNGVIHLLVSSLISKTPLSDVFLPKQKQKRARVDTITTSKGLSISENGTRSNTKKLELKLTVRKSTNMVLCAEAGNDFVDSLFNFLTIPLGSIEDVLKGNSGLGCIDNLYKSVENLDSKWFNTPPPNMNIHRHEENLKMTLLKPGIALNHKSKNLLLQIKEGFEPYFHDPRQSVGSNRSEFEKFAKEPSLFYVMDNLEVRPLSSTPTICLLQELNVPLHDIEEQMISVGELEALSLLKASLTSTSSALTAGLNHMLKKLIDEDVKSNKKKLFRAG
ncbi:hypothetical protein R3W88_023492 [Solanum pinnatisectum]|uniref:DUF674 family protein n=1 Tax=Solanum pinnatisectum TaxID=50273 RepID=A0AAV9M0T0_9SOLN|nr:hypothetical protein R3W88_023492 [Solanum pinnatisectum]